MAYLYNGQPILAPLTITSNVQAFQNETLSLKRQTFQTEAQRWELSFGIAMNGNEGAAFLAHTADYYKSKEMVMPQLNGPKAARTFTGTLTTDAAHLGGDSDISVSATGSGILPVGYFITFSNHDKVYMVTESKTFANNSQLVKIFPSLTSDVALGATVLLGDLVKIKYKLDVTSMQGLSFTDGVLSNVGMVKLIEAL